MKPTPEKECISSKHQERWVTTGSEGLYWNLGSVDTFLASAAKGRRVRLCTLQGKQTKDKPERNSNCLASNCTHVTAEVILTSFSDWFHILSFQVVILFLTHEKTFLKQTSEQNWAVRV